MAYLLVYHLWHDCDILASCGGLDGVNMTVHSWTSSKQPTWKTRCNGWL